MNAISEYKSSILLLIVLGLIIYFPVFFNGFAWDDYPFILQNPSVYQFNLWELLGPNVFNSGLFYRPVPSVYFAMLYTLFEQQAFFYHFVQLALHILNTLLLFVLFLRFFPTFVSTVLTLIFLSHPTNVESVAFISSTTSEIYFLFGISALLLGIEVHIKNTRIFLVFLFLLLAVLTKETGFLFFILILLYRYLYKLDKLGVFLLSGIGTGLVYLILRVSVGGVTFSTNNPLIPMRELSLIDRLANIPAIVVHYLKIFVFPMHLSIWQLWISDASFEGFVLPLILCLILFAALTWYLFSVYRQTKKLNAQKEHSLQTLIFFICWYIIGMSLLAQIVPLEMTVAERWFYFPIVGILGIIGTILQPFLSAHSKHKKVFVIVIIILVGLLSIRTTMRVLDWKDYTTLLQHDVNVYPDNAILMDQYAVALYNEGKIGESLDYENKSVSLWPNYKNLNHLGTMYRSAKQYDKAIEAFSAAIQSDTSLQSNKQETSPELISKTDAFLLDSYIKLANSYNTVGRYNEAVRTSEEGLKKFPSEARLYFQLAYGAYKLGNKQKASEAIKKSYDLSPDELNTHIYNRLKTGQPIE